MTLRSPEQEITVAKLQICLLASELHPYAKAGGLADVMAALGQFLWQQGHDVRLFLPLYSNIEQDDSLETLAGMEALSINLGVHTAHYAVRRGTLGEAGPPVFFIDCPAFYHRGRLYTEDDDEHRRFVLLCRATLEVCQRLAWSPQVIHCNDWQTALTPLYLKTHYGWDRLFENTRTLLGLHNLGYQGQLSGWFLGDLGFAGHVDQLDQHDYHRGEINLLKTGILHADALVTVSPTYAQEIQTPEYGMGLEGVLRSRASVLRGILNGVDYAEWSPERDTYIPQPFSRDDLSGKAVNRHTLLSELGLADSPGAPVIGVVSRLVVQKGFDLMFEVLPELLWREDFRLVVLGSGDPRYEGFFGWLQYEHPRKVGFFRGFNNYLAHLIEAGSDFFLMPSRYEPCGLNQMYSLRYGTIPVVRRTGGLADTVSLFNPETGEGTGVVFDHYDTPALYWALEQAMSFYQDPVSWQRLQANAMAEDFSWEQQGQAYLELYQQLSTQGAEALTD